MNRPCDRQKENEFHGFGMKHASKYDGGDRNNHRKIMKDAVKSYFCIRPITDIQNVLKICENNRIKSR